MTLRTPLIVQGVSALLILAALAFAFGLVGGTRHLLEGINAGESGGQLLWDASRVGYSIVVVSAAVFAVLAMRQRRPIGRWVAVGLGSFVLLRSIPALLYAIRAVNGDLGAPAGMLQFSSPAEAKSALAMTVVTNLFFAVLVIRLAVSREATEYFKPTPSPPFTTLK